MNSRHIVFAIVAISASSLSPFKENLLASSYSGAAHVASPGPKQKSPDSLPHIGWDDFFAKVETTGATYSDRLKELDGKRVVLKGNAVMEPMPPGGLYLTRHPEARLHPDDEDTLPWDAVGVLWRKNVHVARVPSRPSVEGTLRVGNRQVGTETVILVLEDAIPHVEKGATASAAR
jgi:hypothetical protein